MKKHILFALIVLYLFLVSSHPLYAGDPVDIPVADKPVKVGIYQNKPLVFTDEEGTVKGLYADLLDYIAGQEGWRIEYVPCTWAKCLERLESGEIDILAAIAYSEARSREYDFANETVLSNWGQVYTPEKSDIQSVLDLDGKRIAVLEDDIHALKLAEMLDEFKIESKLVKVQDYAMVFKLLEGQSVDAGVVNRLFAIQNERAYQISKTSIIFDPLEIRFAVAKGKNQDLIEVIDKHLIALKEDQNSVYYRSLNKWLGGEEVGALSWPDWLTWALRIAGGLILLFVVVTVVLRTQVRAKTAELRAKNQDLQAEIAERKQAEEALRQSEAQYRSLFDGVPIGLYRTTPAGEILDVNLAMARMLDYPERVSLSDIKTDELYVHPESRREWQALLEQEDVLYDFEIQLFRRDGAIIWVRDSAQVVRDDEGRVLYYDGTVEDITVHKRAEAVIERRNRELMLLTTVIEQTAESVMITDTQGKILYVNPAFERISGYSYSEAVGRTPRILKSGKHDVSFYRELWQQITAGQIWQGRFVNRRKDGSLYTADATVAPVRNAEGEITNYVSVRRDVTQILELEQQYLQAQKMEAIGRLTGGIAHDFNNLLTAINGFAELTKRRLPADSPLQPMVSNIVKSGQLAANLVRQLLVFSRKQNIEPAILDLNLTVADMDEMLQRIIGEHIEMAAYLTSDLWPVKADPGQIQQVIMNLAVNARDAMPQGGKLIIETANIIIDEQIAGQLVDLQAGHYVMLSVRDTGAGMTEEVQAHIFEPFFTTKDPGKGTGLGLATVFGIVKQSGGHIFVNSEAGQGAALQIYLPAAGFVTAPSQQSNPTDAACAGTETILLVEDEASVREMAASLLHQYGYTVLEAADGLQALELVKSHSGEVDLLLVDVILPQMNGKILADQLKQACPAIKILFMSGYPNEFIARYGVLDPAFAFIEKPFNSTALLEKVRQVLDE